MIEDFRIRVFRTVAHHLNFSRAAEELLLTPPAVTQQIKALEDQIGVSLSDRGWGRIVLTPGGMALLPFAEQMKGLQSEALVAVAGAYGGHAGDLSIEASQTIGQYLLPRFVAAFVKTHPKIRVTARSGNTDQMLEALVAGDIQIALIEGPEQRRDVHIEAFMEANSYWLFRQITVGQSRR
jgi:DNA-binding transcriptional LysR family regulator